MKTLEQKVMTRVHRIHTLRKFLHPTLVKLYGASALFMVLASLVSLTNVYANMPSLFAPSAFTGFIVRAVLNTEIFVQALLAGFVVALVLFVRDLVRGEGKETHPFVHA